MTERRAHLDPLAHQTTRVLSLRGRRPPSCCRSCDLPLLRCGSIFLFVRGGRDLRGCPPGGPVGAIPTSNDVRRGGRGLGLGREVTEAKEEALEDSEQDSTHEVYRLAEVVEEESVRSHETKVLDKIVGLQTGRVKM